MKSECQIKLLFKDPKIANIILQSLKPEIDIDFSNRSKIFSKLSNSHELEIYIHASDITAVKAVINSYLHWVDSILEILEPFKQ